MSRPPDVMVGGHGRRGAAAVAALVVVAALATGAFVLLGGDPGSGGEPGGSAGGTAAPTVPDGDPAAVAHAFLDAWAGEDWEALQELTADQSLAAAEEHRLAHRVLGVAGTRIEPGEATPDGDVVRVPFAVTWSLDGLGEHTFSTSLTVARAGGDWRVRWWYPTLHPDMTPERRFERVRVFGERAPILGADGEVLVGSDRRVRVAVEPRRATGGDEPIVDALGDLDGVDLDEVQALLARDDLEPDRRYPVTELTDADFAEVRDRLNPVPGLVFDHFTVRVPAAEGIGGALLGSTGEVTAELLDQLGEPYRAGDVVGRSGLERVHERRLAGEPEQEARIMEGSTLVTTLVYVDGADPEPITVTLLPGAQEAAAGVLAGLDRPAAIVAVDASTGEVRAAASHPSEEFDRALQGRYPPGSTFKVVGATAALAGGLGTGDEVPCPRQARIGGRDFRNAGGYGPGAITFTEAFARSCNTAFALLASEELGAAGLDEAAGLFGFDVEYTVGLPAFGGTYPEPGDQAELAASVIGQGRVEASPLHMASVAAAASSGVWRSPHVVREDVEVLEQPLPGEVLEPLQALMREVVASGTGTAARLDGDPPVAGKTGSAQFGDGSRTHAWFIGYRGDLAFAVVVEGGGGGGSTAAPLAAEFLRALD